MADRSPDGWFYRFDPNGPVGQRLWRRDSENKPWGMGMPSFSVQMMSAAELRFVAGVIDAGREAK